jgi:hypothetical protein
MSPYSSTGMVTTVPRLATKTFGWLSRASTLVRTTPSAPQASALRISVPRFPAYSMPSATSSSRADGLNTCVGDQRGSRTTDNRAGAAIPGWSRANARSEIVYAVPARAMTRGARSSASVWGSGPGHHSTVAMSAPVDSKRSWPQRPWTAVTRSDFGSTWRRAWAYRRASGWVAATGRRRADREDSVDMGGSEQGVLA